MEVKGIDWARGYVECSLDGKHPDLFINMAIKNKFNIWDIRMVNNDQAIFSVSIVDFFKLKPILKKTNSRVHVIKRVGLPFIITKSIRRKGIIIGFISFLLLIYLLSSIIWTINIEGNKRIDEKEIYQVIDEMGIHEGMFKFKLPSQDQIKDQLLNKIDNIAWVGIKVDGTQLNFTIVEKVKPEDKQSSIPSHIIANKNAIVYKVLAEKGLPQVKVNDRVRKGDILISGIVGTEENQQLVSAEGTVLGVVWYETKITLPLKQEWKEYTGNTMERKYISLGSGKRMIKYKGDKDIPYEQYQSSYDYKQLSWRNYQVPIGFITEKILEYENREKILSEEVAIKIALEQTKQDLFSKIKSDSKILSEKVLHQSNDNGKLSLKVLYEVLEDISFKQPIE